MKKILKRIAIILGIVIAAIIILIVAFIFKIKSATKVMKPVETMKVVVDVFSIKDSFVNMFLIKDSDNYIAIDAGNDSKAIETELKKLNINSDKIIAVFLTHTDRDHVSALSLFKNAKVYFSRKEEDMLTGKSKKFYMSNKISAKRKTIQSFSP